MQRVTWLEPRTPHQPEKLQKLSKNEFVLLLLYLESMKNLNSHLFANQSSAGGSQGGAAELVQVGTGYLANVGLTRNDEGNGDA